MLQPEPAKEGVNERHQVRLNKRKAAADALASLREELFNGEFDGYVVMHSSMRKAEWRLIKVVSREPA
jgi:hypothetical protein